MSKRNNALVERVKYITLKPFKGGLIILLERNSTHKLIGNTESFKFKKKVHTFSSPLKVEIRKWYTTCFTCNLKQCIIFSYHVIKSHFNGRSPILINKLNSTFKYWFILKCAHLFGFSSTRSQTECCSPTLPRRSLCI